MTFTYESGTGELLGCKPRRESHGLQGQAGAERDERPESGNEKLRLRLSYKRQHDRAIKLTISYDCI